jgi:hypothetical protein
MHLIPEFQTAAIGHKQWYGLLLTFTASQCARLKTHIYQSQNKKDGLTPVHMTLPGYGSSIGGSENQNLVNALCAGGCRRLHVDAVSQRNPSTPAVSTNETTLHQSTSAVESEPAIKEMSQNYLLARLAEELGANGAATSIRDQLTSAGFQDRDFGNWKRK